MGHLSLTGFKLIRVGLTIHGSSLKNRHFVAKRATKTQEYNKQAEHYFILFLVINTCECLICLIYQ